MSSALAFYRDGFSGLSNMNACPPAILASLGFETFQPL
jgi:hypothetical protein